jgi:hypothetical protein
MSPVERVRLWPLLLRGEFVGMEVAGPWVDIFSGNSATVWIDPAASVSTGPRASSGNGCEVKTSLQEIRTTTITLFSSLPYSPHPSQPVA